MEYQLRHYRIRAGSMDAFLDAWVRGVYPLRRKFGFRFAGAWRVDGADEFVWIIGYEGPEGFAAADKRYYCAQARKRTGQAADRRRVSTEDYESEERRHVSPDPAQYVEAPLSQIMRSVLPD